MGISCNGRYVLCDGEGCQAKARLPVALRPVLNGDGTAAVERIEGWLFAVAGEQRHYCPSCVSQYLSNLDAVLDAVQRGRAE